MIHQALQLIRDELQQFLNAKMKPQQNVNYASLVNPTNDQGESNWPSNALGLSLVNVEEERILRNQAPQVRRDGSDLALSGATMKLHLYLLVSSHFGDYTDALRFLSYTLSFFQTKAVFTPQNAPTMPAGMDQLNVALHSLTFEQMNQLWGTIGTKYLPSALYVVKLVSLGEEAVERVLPPITRTQFKAPGEGA